MIASFGLSRRSGNFSNELTEVQRDRLLDPFSSRTLALHQRQAIELTESFADGREYARECESTDFQSRNPCPRGRHAYRVGFAEGILAVPPFPMYSVTEDYRKFLFMVWRLRAGLGNGG